MNVQALTACCIFNEAKDNAGNDNFYNLLATFLPKSAYLGCDPLVLNSFKAFTAIRDNILTFLRHAIKDANIKAVNAAGLCPLARFIIKRIVYKHRDSKYNYKIVRSIQPKKPFLTPADKES